MCCSIYFTEFQLCLVDLFTHLFIILIHLFIVIIILNIINGLRKRRNLTLTLI